jgi:tetratricopeptide (TPR) repeat protein
VLDFVSLDEALTWCEGERAGLVAATKLASASGMHQFAWELPAAAMSFFYRRSHWTEWVTTHEFGLASTRASGDREAQAWMLNNLGMAYSQQRMGRSVECFEQALTIYQEVGDMRGRSRAATNVAAAYHDLRRFQDALAAAERSLVIQRSAGTRYGEGIALGILGGANQELGHSGEAVVHLQQALAIFRELNDRDSEADSLSDLGDVYLGLDRTEEAISHYQESLAIRRDIGDRYGQARTLRRLGSALLRTGQHGPGRELLSESLDLFEALGDQPRAAEIRASLAGLVADAR